MHRTRSVFASRHGLVLSVLAALASGLSGCGGSEPGSSRNPEEGPLLPFKTGNSWTYRVTEAGFVSNKTTTIGDLVVVGGVGPNATKMAFNVITRKGTDLSDQTESWQGPSDESPDRFVRYREISYGETSQMPNLETYWNPSKVHIDGRAELLMDGRSWQEDYEEGKISFDGTLPIPLTPTSDVWTVISVDETVTVNGTQYDHTVHFRKVSESSAQKEYWYKPNVGKIKETGTQTEELVDFSPK